MVQQRKPSESGKDWYLVPLYPITRDAPEPWGPAENRSAHADPDRQKDTGGLESAFCPFENKPKKKTVDVWIWGRC